MTPTSQTTSLLPDIADGDVSSFEELYDRHAPTLYAVLLRILGNPDDAEEVLQETFVKAWGSAGSFDPSRGTEIAWLISICRSRAIDRLRSRKVRGDREDQAGREISTLSGFVDNRTGADQAIRSEQQSAVRTALSSLPDAQRTALHLAYFDGLSQSEIAARLNEPLGTIKTRMQLGMKKLRESLRAFRS